MIIVSTSFHESCRVEAPRLTASNANAFSYVELETLRILYSMRVWLLLTHDLVATSSVLAIPTDCYLVNKSSEQPDTKPSLEDFAQISFCRGPHQTP